MSNEPIYGLFACEDCGYSCDVVYKTYKTDNTVVYKCYDCAINEEEYYNEMRGHDDNLP
jgi:hypothetical protein